MDVLLFVEAIVPFHNVYFALCCRRSVTEIGDSGIQEVENEAQMIGRAFLHQVIDSKMLRTVTCLSF